MYTLYFMKGACSLATQVIMRELKVDFVLVDKASVSDFHDINPVGAVPVVKVDDRLICEGAAIILHLMGRHPDQKMSKIFLDDEQHMQNLMFANATVHPAYSRLFFLAPRLEEGAVAERLLADAATEISRLWAVVEHKLDGKRFLGGDSPSPADILLAVYSGWGRYFPVDIKIGSDTRAMIDAVRKMGSYRLSESAESERVVAV